MGLVQFFRDLALLPDIWRDALGRARVRRHAASPIGRIEAEIADQAHVRANLALRLVALRSAEARR